MASHKLVAVMYTDIVGYTAITDSDEQLAHALNEKHRAVVSANVNQFQGVVFEMVGDGTLSYFTSASDCVQAAVEIQTALQDDPKVPVRIGIHIGEVRGDGELVYGNPLNVASRIESLGIPGSILLSGNVIDSMSGKGSFAFISLGFFSFKNVDKPIEIYAVRHGALRIPDRDEVSGKLKVLERKDIVVFEEWDDRELANRLTTAKHICQQAVCSYGFINYNYNKLRAFIQSGGQFHAVMIHPQSIALQVSPDRQAGAASDVNYVRGQLQLAYTKLKGLGRGVRFQLTHHLPDPIMTFVDPETEEGVLFITLTGFRMDLHARPSFVLRKSTHEKWFIFYWESFEKLCASPETSDVDFTIAWEDVK